MNSVSKTDPRNTFRRQRMPVIYRWLYNPVCISMCVFKFLPGFVIWPLGTKRLKNEIYESLVSDSSDPVNLQWLKACPDFGGLLAAAGHLEKEQKACCRSGDEGDAEFEVSVWHWDVTWLSSTAHEGKYTYSHILEIIHGLWPLEKNCAFSGIWCAENCTRTPPPHPPTPRLFAKLNVKMKSFANVRATFSSRYLKKIKAWK